MEPRHKVFYVLGDRRGQKLIMQSYCRMWLNYLAYSGRWSQILMMYFRFSLTMRLSLKTIMDLVKGSSVRLFRVFELWTVSGERNGHLPFHYCIARGTPTSDGTSLLRLVLTKSLFEPTIVLDVRAYTACISYILHCIGIASTPMSGVASMGMAWGLYLHHDMDGVLAPHSLHFPDDVWCDHMTCTDGGVDGMVGIVRRTVRYDVADHCLYWVGVDSPASYEQLVRPG